MTDRANSPDLVASCAYAAMAVALPTALWRLPVAAGFPLGTPEAWRDEQQIPGTGTWYLLGLSLVQIAAIACMVALTVDPARLTPRWLRGRRGRLVPTVVGTAGLAGALVLTLLVTMSVIAWDKVDPFGGADYDGWAWLCAACYLLAALWPPLLGAASIGYLVRHRRSVPGGR
ncbi:hypothetical protein BJF85_17375 [Saccharomonospora sp. CUA-673]|uniref:hypothetical protein n=1 Tax=Saccharomonospora sp. CUA-673 TaxID=1904969 RepID=UPI0009593652|nr:hypothetical protein [Saccharomonospora sp. CUA-673]OLT46384.1 hypothetical protein BJF85_17375 [Saccharomonospora sp. CUA-673]